MQNESLRVGAGFKAALDLRKKDRRAFKIKSIKSMFYTQNGI
jgi:hypothetical protein